MAAVLKMMLPASCQIHGSQQASLDEMWGILSFPWPLAMEMGPRPPAKKTGLISDNGHFVMDYNGTKISPLAFSVLMITTKLLMFLYIYFIALL